MAREMIWRNLVVAMSVAWLAGCVTLPPNAKPAPQDPLERWNRGVYKVNDVLDRSVAKPLARTYVKITPKPIRTGLDNFIANLEIPTTMLNDALQGKLKAACVDLGRLLMNTTLGLGGIFDPATRAGLDHNDEDFGQTLGVWGVPPGPFIELPLLGPSDLRDGPSAVVDDFTNPAHYANRTARWSYDGVDLVHKRAQLLPLEPSIQAAFDPYAFVRDAFLQNRRYKVADGNVPDEQLEDPDAPAQQPKPKQ